MESVRRLSRTLSMSDGEGRKPKPRPLSAQTSIDSFTNVQGKTHTIYTFNSFTVYEGNKKLNLITQPQFVISTNKTISILMAGRYIYLDINTASIKIKKR